MVFRAVIDWLLNSSSWNRPDGLSKHDRVAIRVRRDGKTDYVRVGDSSALRSALVAVLTAVMMLAVLWMSRAAVLKLSVNPPSPTAAIA